MAVIEVQRFQTREVSAKIRRPRNVLRRVGGERLRLGIRASISEARELSVVMFDGAADVGFELAARDVEPGLFIQVG